MAKVQIDELDREEQDWVENSLIEAERRKCVRKVLDIQKLTAVAKGDNYTSDLSRLRVKVQQLDGRVVDRWVIYKTLPHTALRHKYMKQAGLFRTEFRMYQDVLPELESIRREKEVGEPYWGESYALRNYESLLLEDLSVLGYKMGQRKEGLDLKHCSIAMRALGKFHALTAIHRERGNLIISDFERHFLERNIEMMGKFYTMAFEDLTKSLETKWEDEWKVYAKALRKLNETLIKDLHKNFTIEHEKFNVLNHGDCWVNNVLFKYDAENNPVSLRFIDFQMSFYNSPGYDLQYFLNTSPSYDVRLKKNELLQIYYESLTTSLRSFEYEGEIPTMEDIHNGLQKAALYGLVTAVSLLPLMLLKKEDVPDMEEMLKLSEENPEDVPTGLISTDTEAYRNIMKIVLKDFEERGILQL
ncbi:uncharacterized protein [Halyomorpha halys]|uniref:uncharacterized protein n=1 Tax=Halyomorpha halys TaxID=286706 RepID=UPI0006D51911|nr:uncharacterized protein LOC106682295 [Halyomorpha halys]KAE8573988.1 EcKinase 4 [Halyomorpha halys]